MNPKDLMKNLQNMQSRVGDMQEKMKELSVAGSAGGDMVNIEINGQMEVTRVKISPEAVDPNDIEMLEDLVFAAFSDATAKMKEKMQEEMSSITGGMNLPPGIFGA